MQWKVLLVLVGILSLSVGNASASLVDVTAWDTSGAAIDATHNYATCPMSLTPQHIQVKVKNVGTMTDTYALKVVQKPSAWDVQVQDDVALAPGEEKSLDLFLVNIPSPQTAPPGVYNIVIEAKSFSAGHTDQVTLPIQVLACYSVTLNAPVTTVDVCQEKPVTQDLSVDVVNTGKYTDTFSVTSSQSWAVPSKSTVTLASGAKETIKVSLTPSSTAKGVQTVQVTAKSVVSYATSSVSLNANVKDCYDYAIVLRPTSERVCTGESETYTLDITNKGLPDTFTITTSSPIAVPSLNSIVDLSARTESVKVNVTPKLKGVQNFDVSVTSKVTGVTQKTSASVDTLECRAVAVVVSPAEQTACYGQKAEYTVTVKNTGLRTETYQLTASRGTLDKTSVTLTAGTSTTVKLTVDYSSTAANEDILSVTAQAGDVKDSSNTLITFENCYDATLTITPTTADVCPCQSVTYTTELANKGKLQDTYTFNYFNTSEKVTLRPGEKRTSIFTVPISCDAKAALSVQTSASSSNVQKTATSAITMKSTQSCFGASLTNGKAATVDILEGVAIPVKLKNTGVSQQTFAISLTGPSWVYIAPKSLTLQGGQEEQVYVYATPVVGTKEGVYPIRVTSRSTFIETTHDISVTVGKGGEVVVTPPAETPTETPTEKPTETPTETPTEKPTETPSNDNGTTVLSPEPGITLNITFENLTGELVKHTETTSFKTIAIGIITIIIIVILVVRFAILVRK